MTNLQQYIDALEHMQDKTKLLFGEFEYEVCVLSNNVMFTVYHKDTTHEELCAKLALLTYEMKGNSFRLVCLREEMDFDINLPANKQSIVTFAFNEG